MSSYQPFLLARAAPVMCALLLAGQAWAYGTLPASAQSTRLFSVRTAANSNTNATGYTFTSPQAACQRSIDLYNPGCAGGTKRFVYFDTPVTASTQGRCDFYAQCPGFSEGIQYQGSVGFVEENTVSCPTDSTALVGSPSTCVCNSGFKVDGTQCVPINCQAVRDSMTGQYFEWLGNVSSFCYGGCTIQAGVRGYLSSTNKSSAEGSSLIADSSSCQGADGGNNLTGNDPGVGLAGAACPARQCPGTVNGQAVCVPCSNNTTQGPSTTASAPTGAASAPQIPGAPPGSVSSSESTTCGGGTCATTTTYRDSNGNITGESTTEDTQEGFCAENPGLSICRDSAFSGSCAATTCSGDAVQCAIAKEQAARNCEFFGAAPGDDPAVLAANGQPVPEGHPLAGLTPVALQSFDQTDLIASACPADVTIAVGNLAPAVLRVSELCTPASWLGNLLVGLTALACLGIVFGTRGGS